MKNYKIKELENIFEELVKYANEKKNNQNVILEKKDKYIEFVYQKIGQYLMSKKIRLSNSYLDAYVLVVYNSELYGEKTYIIFCPFYSQKEIFIPDNIYNFDCHIVNFVDVINYHKEENKKDQLKNIKIAINELSEQGLSNEEIENYINNTLYNVIENPKQKIKRPQK